MGREPRHGAEDQHRGQGRQRPHAGMGHEPPRLVVGRRSGGDLPVEGVDVRVEPAEELEARVAPRGQVGRPRERLQLRPAATREQRGARREPVVEGNRVQTILHHGAHPDEAHPMRHEGAPIPHAGIGDPDARKAILHEQLQQVGGIAPVRLRYAGDHGANLGGVPHLAPPLRT